MPSFARTLAVSALLAAAPLAAQLPVELHRNPAELLASPDATLTANKRVAFDFWRIVIDAHHADRAPEFLADDFIDHDTTTAGGLRNLIERAGHLPRKAQSDAPAELVSVLAERDLVVLAFRRELLDLAEEGQTYTTTSFEMFRIDGGKIAERWTFAAQD
jgi:predicted SnoaL-like aldol condensation-catalyzing enzyme